MQNVETIPRTNSKIRKKWPEIQTLSNEILIDVKLVNNSDI